VFKVVGKRRNCIGLEERGIRGGEGLREAVDLDK
jgi:hypothetical protein